MDDRRLVGNEGFHDPRGGHRPQVRHANGDHTGPSNKGGMARYARALNLPGRIRFCNWGGFVAEGVIEAYEYADNGQKHSWSTPTIPSRQCSTFNVPKGTPIAAHITMHIWSGMYFAQYGWKYWPNHTDSSGWNDYSGYGSGTANDDIVATYDLSAPYTNTTFNFYGTTCNATTGVTQDDFLSAQVSTVDDAHEAFGCQDAGEANGGSASALGRLNEALETVEDLFDVLGSLLRTSTKTGGLGVNNGARHRYSPPASAVQRSSVYL